MSQHHNAYGSDSASLRTRVAILEAALACIQDECDLAFEEPEVAFSTMCRIASVARQALPTSEAA
jgi:hypothetical protein